MQASPRRTTEKLEEEGANEFGKDGDPEGWHWNLMCRKV